MGEIQLRCRQCNWSTRIDRARIPRYGARIRCPECDRLQDLAPIPSEDGSDLDDLLEREAGAAPGPAGERRASHRDRPPVGAGTKPARGEARQVLALWLQELQRGRDTPLTEAVLYREYGEELAELFAVWGASYPGERASQVFREQLAEALERLDPGTPSSTQGA